MSSAIKIFMIYLLSLIACSLLLSAIKYYGFYWYLFDIRFEFRIMTWVTLIGGIVALNQLVSKKALKIFLIIYFSLWLLRFLILYLSDVVGVVHFGGRAFHLNHIAPSYYRTVSRIETPLPFIIYWLVLYLLNRFNLGASQGNEEIDNTATVANND